MQVKEQALRIANDVANKDARSQEWFEPAMCFAPIRKLLPIDVGAILFVQIDTRARTWIVIARRTPYPDDTGLVAFWHESGETGYSGDMTCK